MVFFLFFIFILIVKEGEMLRTFVGPARSVSLMSLNVLFKLLQTNTCKKDMNRHRISIGDVVLGRKEGLDIVICVEPGGLNAAEVVRMERQTGCVRLSGV